MKKQYTIFNKRQVSCDKNRVEFVTILFNNNSVNAFHSGCIGDIIYSIPTMKALGVTSLYVDDRPWTKPIVNRIDAFKRLIESQGISVKKHEDENIDFDLSTYRNGGMIYGDNIANRVARWMGVKIDLSKPWMKISEKNTETKGKIVVSRGARWHGEFFPWKTLVSELGDKMIFVGMREEHKGFCDRYGDIPHLRTNDLYDVATAIAGADLFIGNQSSPNAIANGIHKESIVETCLYAFDCIYDRPNTSYCHDGILKVRFDGKTVISESNSPKHGWMVKIFGRTLKAEDKHICIALARADCHLRGIYCNVDQIEQLAERY